MAGTLTTSSLAKVKSLELSNFDIKLFIALKTKTYNSTTDVMDSLSKYGFVHVPQLAPSEQLFKSTQAWKKLYPGNWWPSYVEVFNKEMSQFMFQVYLERIKMRLDEGKNVLLVCYCPNVNQCHRGLIADYFKGLGYTINRL